jgi:hypothetical protein
VADYLADRRVGQCKVGATLWGACGTGKTATARALARITGGRFVRAIDLAEAWIADTEAFEERYLHPTPYTSATGLYVPDLIIDDIGREPEANRYGTRLEVIANVIDAWEGLLERYDARLIVTTNLLPEDVANRYHARTLSRLAGMTRAIRFAGPDRRNERDGGAQ